MSEAPAIVPKTGAGLMLLSSHPNLMKTRVSIAAKGIMEVVRNRPFKILIENLMKKPMEIMKHMLVAIGVQVPDMTVKIPGRTTEDGDDTEQTMNAIPIIKKNKRNT